MYRMDLTGFRNHIKDESGLLKSKKEVKVLLSFDIKTYVGFSRALGSSRPRPAGDFSASSVPNRMSSASTLPGGYRVSLFWLSLNRKSHPEVSAHHSHPWRTLATSLWFSSA